MFITQTLISKSRGTFSDQFYFSSILSFTFHSLLILLPLLIIDLSPARLTNNELMAKIFLFCDDCNRF